MQEKNLHIIHKMGLQIHEKRAINKYASVFPSFKTQNTVVCPVPTSKEPN